MTRLCFVGDSHIGSLKLGWDRLSQELPGTSADFVALAGKSSRHIKIAGDQVVFNSGDEAGEVFSTLGTRRAFCLNDYDAVIFSLNDLSVYSLLELYESATLDERIATAGSALLVSDAFLVSGTIERVRRSRAFKLACAAAVAAQGQIWIVPAPFPSAEMLGSTRKRHQDKVRKFALLKEGGGEHVLERNFNLALENINGGSINVLPQPDTTKDGALYTKHIYSVGSRKMAKGLNEDHPGHDYSHMNADYGAIVLQDLLVKAFG